jgi:hypothetical protein
MMRIKFVAILVLGLISITVSRATVMTAKSTRPKVACTEGSVCEGFQLSASVEPTTIPLGDPIVLTLALKNTTKVNLYLASSGPEKDFMTNVRREDGRSVDVSEYGRKLLLNRGVIYARFGVKAGPGEVLKYALELNKIYDMSSGGTYLVTIKRDIRTRDRRALTQVVSNTVKVVVK